MTLTIVDTQTTGAIARVIQLADDRLALTAAIAAAVVELAQ